MQVLCASLLMNVTPIHVMDLQHVWKIPLDDIVVTAQRDGLEKIAVLTLMIALPVVVRRVTMAAHASTHLDHLYVSVHLVTQVIIILGPTCTSILQEKEVIQTFSASQALQPKYMNNWRVVNIFSCAVVVAGDRCEFSVNECASNPCKNKAPCLDYVNEFKCICPLGWTGKTCDVDINECSSNPCKNEGQCVNELNSYRCKCKPAFNGTNCEINIDDCANPNPCQNGATCSDGLASYTCSCASGFTGKQCETNIDDCQSLPCQHYGTCVDGINSYSCVCAPGYTGKNCDVDYDECSSNPCMFGGTCENKQNGFQCSCPKGTSGKLPEN